MRIAAVVALSLLAAACAGADEPPEEGAPAPDRVRKVLVIGVDGVRPDILAQVATPNLDALAREGTFDPRARTGDPTVSGPGWSSLLIGVWPEKHGVTGNDFSDNRYGDYPDFLTRIEQVRPELRTFAAADWLPLVGDDSGGPLIGDAPDVKVVLDGYELGWREADVQVVDSAVSHLRDGDPDAAFVYLGDPDESSHEAGSIGPEYREAIAAADEQIGRLMEAVRSRPSFPREDWLVLVSTDHGRRADGGHGGDTSEERTIFYVASGPSALRGTPSDTTHIVDVAVTALAHLGIPADPAWGLDGKVVGLRR